MSQTVTFSHTLFVPSLPMSYIGKNLHWNLVHFCLFQAESFCVNCYYNEHGHAVWPGAAEHSAQWTNVDLLLSLICRELWSHYFRSWPKATPLLLRSWRKGASYQTGPNRYPCSRVWAGPCKWTTVNFFAVDASGSMPLFAGGTSRSVHPCRWCLWVRSALCSCQSSVRVTHHSWRLWVQAAIRRRVHDHGMRTNGHTRQADLHVHDHIMQVGAQLPQKSGLRQASCPIWVHSTKPGQHLLSKAGQGPPLSSKPGPGPHLLPKPGPRLST